MSFVDEYTQSAILNLIGKRVTNEQFFKAMHLEPGTGSDLGLAMLRRALAEHDSDGVEFGLYVGYHFGFSPDYLGVLMRLAGEGWHQKHEDVITALDRLRAPEAADTFFRTATVKHPYLDYDEAFALGVKSIYGLAHLETPEAIGRLAKLLHSGNPILEREAAARLSDLHRGGSSEEIRAAARDALS